MKFTRLALLAIAGSASAVSLSAQGLPSQKILTIEVAQSIAQNAMEACRANGYHVKVLVVDEANREKAFLRDNGAGNAFVTCVTVDYRSNHEVFRCVARFGILISKGGQD